MTSLAIRPKLPAVKFTGKGTGVKGTIVDLRTRTATVYRSNPPVAKTDKYGNEVKETVVTLQVPGGEQVALYVNSWRMERAIKDAFVAKDCKDIEVEGELGVWQSGTEDVEGAGQAAKTYVAEYEPPFDPTA